ncbi:hypothetical protein BUALT_Bualt08G0046400 [Buddleja alternifolia]|uniref:B30.2/SPRY domain-containing protein n=1 Tax=Buddleja alternifolia TaxID=168488 RepID=A0AAV6XEN4_9LAMI|nr:hypothetical protein BUALT_Bualt08G0046400 [Buddleja alternifolia]
MIEWLHVTLVAASAGFLAVVILLIMKRCLCKNVVVSDTERGQSGISRLHQVSPHHNHNHHHDLFQKGSSTELQGFNWADHPSLVTDAVENGWSRFAFKVFVSSSPSVKSKSSSRARLGLGTCVSGDRPGNENHVEIDWEVCEGSSDYMQKIRLNPELKISKNSVYSLSVIRTGLPLPGPHLGTSSFPQEAYFEITILSHDDQNSSSCDQRSAVDKKGAKSEGEKIKLITEDFNAKTSKDSISHVTSQRRSSKIEEVKNGGVIVSVGLTTGGGPLRLQIPGSYPGSIGFNSTGSVYLDGTKLVFDSVKDEWGRSDKVIGCGYNPSQKKVFFTVDSLLVHEIHCQTEVFGSPLYPTLAANSVTMVLVNLGQSPFKFMPANLQRTCNPCFIGPLENSPSVGYEDSKELFSMGRIDAQWLQRSATRSNNNTVNSIKALEYDQESEGDLFEIVLDSTGRSPC